MAVVMAVCQAAATDSIAVRPVRPVVSAYAVEIGSGHVADTYLSPLNYSGWTTAFSYERMQAMKFDPRRWAMQLKVDVGLTRTDNPARNASIWAAGLSGRWGMMRRWTLDNGLTLAAGGSTSINLGALYTTRNGNKPVAAKASWTVNATASASIKVRLLGKPVVVRYQPTLPLTGIFFSQQYGELYYEIYLGDRSGLVHGAWPGNYFALDNLLTADILFGATALRVGYHNSVLSTRVSNLTTRLVSHSFLIGVSGEWFSIAPGHKISHEAEVISAWY